MTGLAAPTTNEGLQELLNDTTKVTQLIADGKLGDVITGYVENTRKKDPSVEEQVKQQVQNNMAEFLRTHGDQKENDARLDITPTNKAIAEKIGAVNAHTAPGAAVDRAGLFRNSGEYLKAIHFRNQHPQALAAQEKLRTIRAEFGSTIPGDGGFLIPETLRAQLLSVALEKSVMRSRATVIPMDSLRVPMPALDSSSNSGSVYGGMVGYWTEEAGQLTDSSATFKRVVLEAKKLTGYSEIPNELFTDSIVSLSAFIEQKWPEAIAFFEDISFFDGNGVTEPLGFLNGGSVIAVAKESGQAADTILWENIVKMYSRMLPSSLGNAVWIANQTVFPELATMALSVGTGGAPVWLTDGAAGSPMSILGRPVFFTEKAKVLGDQGDIAFIDPSYYLIGDRRAMTIDTSTHYKFQNDQTAVRIIERVDGRPWLDAAITPVNGSTVSPFVALAARA